MLQMRIRWTECDGIGGPLGAAVGVLLAPERDAVEERGQTGTDGEKETGMEWSRIPLM